jgi:hypothetical protein
MLPYVFARNEGVGIMDYVVVGRGGSEERERKWGGM